MKKISFLLAILMLATCLFLAACNQNKEFSTTPEETTVPEENIAPDLSPKILATDISKYILVCAQRSSSTVMGQFWQLQSQIKQMQ